MFETPNGKKIQLKRCPKSSQYKVEFATGGELPEELSGSFSTEALGNMAILMYLDRVSKKKPQTNKE